MLHHFDNSLVNYGSRLLASDPLADFPGLSTVYLRLAWSYLEPQEGRFRWEIVDSPAQRWVARGKAVAFRFSASEGEPGVGTPGWVRDAGAKGYCFEGGKGVVPDRPGCTWESDFDDPVFLEKLDHFLAAAAARYDGEANVAWVDVGSFGIWGEGHTFWTPLAWKSAGLAERFWPRAPVILESEHYGGAKQRGSWGDGHAYLDAVEAYHASYASIHWWPREFLAENRSLVDHVNRRLGYRLQLVEASWPESVRVGEAFSLAARWRNAGVAPCLPGGRVAFTLKDAAGGILAVFVDPDLDVRTLKVAPSGAVTRETTARVPESVAPGEYEVFVSVGSAAGTPALALPLDGDDGRHRYQLGRIRVQPPGGPR